MPWFVYDPAARMVHEKDGCKKSYPGPVQREMWITIGNKTWLSLDAAVEGARLLLDDEAQGCQNCEKKYLGNRGISDDGWREMVRRWMNTV